MSMGAVARGVSKAVVRCCVSISVAPVLLCLRFASSDCWVPSWPVVVDVSPRAPAPVPSAVRAYDSDRGG